MIAIADSISRAKAVSTDACTSVLNRANGEHRRLLARSMAASTACDH